MTPGSSVVLQYTKWNGDQHWSCQGVHLGADEHGTWIGLPPGTQWSKPGSSSTWPWASLLLIPEGQYVARFLFQPPTAELPDPVSVYVDVTTPPVRTPGRVEAVDLDLDVIRMTSGRVYVEDEDEFEEHRVAYAYPADLARGALETTGALVAAVSAGTEPFGSTPALWLQRLEDHLA